MSPASMSAARRTPVHRAVAAMTVVCLAVALAPVLDLFTATPAHAATAAAGDLFPLTAARVADTRTGVAVSKGKLAAKVTRSVTVAGTHGVPAQGAAAVFLSITVASPTKATAVTVWPKGATRPTRSTLQARAG